MVKAGHFEKIKIVDTFIAIKVLKEKLKNQSILDCWREYSSFNNEIKCKCESDITEYDLDNDVLPILFRALNEEYHLLTEAHMNFNNIIQNIEKNILKYFPIDFDITIYFYIGLCNGAGWVTKINNITSILLGGEKIVELKWHKKDQMESLILHELGHAIHFNLRENIEDDIDYNRSIYQLYHEGFAEYFQFLISGKEIVSRNPETIQWCNDNLNDICQEYLKLIHEKKSTQHFFGDWVDYKGHSDVGYIIGRKFIEYLLDEYTILEITVLDFAILKEKLYLYLENGNY